jgi:CTP synthase
MKSKKPKTPITIGLIGKYVEMQDCYKSILEALFMQELQMRLK